MGNKVNPIGLRIGINKDWKSRWYVDPRDYAKTLHEDLALRRRIVEIYPSARAPTFPRWKSFATRSG